MHTGVGAAHWAFVEHCGATRHSNSLGSQTGFAAGHSELARHSTHLPFVSEQCGALAGQSAFVAHDTQRFRVSSQSGVGAAQSVFDRQPTHAPLAASQIFASPEHTDGFDAHEG